jgi:hypothetical protein
MTDDPDDGAVPPQPPDQNSDALPDRFPAVQPPARVKADTPEGLLAIVPHLLGFYPSRSLVVLGIGGPHNRVQVTFRYDLPDPADSALAVDIADHAASVLERQRLRVAVLVGYGPGPSVIPALVTVADWLATGGVLVREVIRAEGGRYWCLGCEDPGCCPPEGRPFDPGSHPLATVMAGAGMQALPDRAALARTLLPLAGSTEPVRRATRRAERRLCDLGSRRWTEGGPHPRQVAARAGRVAVQRAVRRYRAGGTITSADELAWLSVLLADLRVRDDAWARMDPEHHEAHARLWTDVLRAAATEYLPAPASLLAFTAWQSGNGSLAAVAIDRALAARPGYSMALLLDEALRAGLPPSAASLPMTPAEVAASYDAQQAEAEAARAEAGRVEAARAAEAAKAAGNAGSKDARGAKSSRRQAKRAGPRRTTEAGDGAAAGGSPAARGSAAAWSAERPAGGSGRRSGKVGKGQPDRARSDSTASPSGARTSGASKRPSG